MDIQLADVLLHIDENLGLEDRARLEGRLRSIDGVVGVYTPIETPHLAVVEYVPGKTSSVNILANIRRAGVHAELVN